MQMQSRTATTIAGTRFARHALDPIELRQMFTSIISACSEAQQTMVAPSLSPAPEVDHTAGLSSQPGKKCTCTRDAPSSPLSAAASSPSRRSAASGEPPKAARRDAQNDSKTFPTLPRPVSRHLRTFVGGYQGWSRVVGAGDSRGR